MRTSAPHVRYQCRPQRLSDIRLRILERRAPSLPRPSLTDLRVAAQHLTDAGTVPFTLAQLEAQVAEDGARWSHETLRELLLLEAASQVGQLERVRTGHYRVRSTHLPVPSGTVQAHVLAALVRLADSGHLSVARWQVEQEVRTGGVLYSRRSVADGLLRLRRQSPPVVECTELKRYRLVSKGPQLGLAKPGGRVTSGKPRHATRHKAIQDATEGAEEGT